MLELAKPQEGRDVAAGERERASLHGDALEALAKTLDQVKSRIDALIRRQDVVEHRLEKIEGQLTNTGAQMSHLTARAGKLEVGQRAVTNRLQAVEADVRSVRLAIHAAQKELECPEFFSLLTSPLEDSARDPVVVRPRAAAPAPTKLRKSARP